MCTRSPSTARTGSPASRRSRRCRWCRTRSAPGSCQLIGGSMLSFYDWYADLPVASPQMFGDQTDVPESGDWWDASYLMMWGSNVRSPARRTRTGWPRPATGGRRSWWCRPDYADNVKFADEWLPAQPAPTAPSRWRWATSSSRSSSSTRPRPPFVDYVSRYTDLPYLVALEPIDGGGYRARASSSPPPISARPMPRRRVQDRCCGTPPPTRSRCPTGRSGIRFSEAGVGKWNLDLGAIVPRLSCRRRRREPRWRCRASTTTTDAAR